MDIFSSCFAFCLTLFRANCFDHHYAPERLALSAIDQNVMYDIVCIKFGTQTSRFRLTQLHNEKSLKIVLSRWINNIIIFSQYRNAYDLRPYIGHSKWLPYCSTVSTGIEKLFFQKKKKLICLAYFQSSSVCTFNHVLWFNAHIWRPINAYWLRNQGRGLVS